jgi:hypothetical protein
MGERVHRYRPPVAKRRRLTERGAQRLAERERAIGLDPEDGAARWLAEHDPVPEPVPSKSAFKSKELHRWRQQQERKHS